MYTTIQVKDSTKALLKEIKEEEEDIKSYDKVIMELVYRSRKGKKSMFGFFPKDGDVLDGLRDKHERF
jgi:hypothetical protein